MNNKSLIINIQNELDINLNEYQDIVGMEYGSLFLLKNKINSYHISDFDSITKEQLNELLAYYKNQVIKLDVNKDYSDLEMAIKFLIEEKKYLNQSIYVIISIENKRLDHFLNQFYLANKYSGITFLINKNLFFSLKKGKFSFLRKDYDYKYFSIFTFKKSIISIENAKFNVNKAEINSNNITSFISNQFSDDSNLNLKITIDEGEIIILFSN